MDDVLRTVQEKYRQQAVLVNGYLLASSDNGGNSFDKSRWKKFSDKCFIIILAPKDFDSGATGDCVCKIESDEGQIISFHLVHPGTVMKASNQEKGRMFWVQEYKSLYSLSNRASKEFSGQLSATTYSEICLEVVFAEREEAEEFEKLYKKAQNHMKKVHDKEKHLWEEINVVETIGTQETEPVLVEKEEADADEEFATEDEEDDDESTCSEISLDESSEDEKLQQKPKTPFKFPTLEEQSRMWKCPVCTTPNPEASEECLCCKAMGQQTFKPGSEKAKDAEKKEAEAKAAPPVSFTFPKIEQKETKPPAFNFNLGTSKPSTGGSTFSFGVPSTTSSGSDSKPTFSFGVKKEEIDSKKEEAAKPKSNPYPPMETMKKVDQFVPGQEKPKSNPYPPMETMKKVEQFVPGTEKPKSNPYPPMETMKKVEQFVPGQEKKQDTPSFSFSANATPTKPTFNFSQPSTGSPSFGASFGTSSFGLPKSEGNSAFGSSFGTSTFGQKKESSFGSSGFSFSSPKTGADEKQGETKSTFSFSGFSSSGNSSFGDLGKDKTTNIFK